MADDTHDNIAFFGLSRGKSRHFPAIQASLRRRGTRALDRVYAAISARPALSRLFGSGDRMQHARSRQLEHWTRLFTTGIDSEFVASATRIGEIHAKIGLEPSWYIGAYAMMVEELIADLIGHRRWRNPRETSEIVATLVKSSMYDMQLAVSTYFEAESRERSAAMAKVGSALTGIAAGDLETPLTGVGDRFHQLQEDFEKMRTAMRAAMAEVADAAQVIDTGSAEIAQASEDLAQRTEQQASGVQQSASAMEEIAATVTGTARGVVEMRRVASDASSEANGGREIIAEAEAAMAALEQSSSEIGAIIGLIDGIAFQTNLLALNAGVEAARAGESGRGFAVVASEVRALAQRAADAAGDIKQRISGSSAHVRASVELVGRAGKALTIIAERIGEVNNLVADIDTASREQATAVAEVNQSIGYTDRATQQNAAMVEQSAAAARSLSGEAARLATLVGRFSVDSQLQEKRSTGRSPSRRRAA